MGAVGEGNEAFAAAGVAHSATAVVHSAVMLPAPHDLGVPVAVPGGTPCVAVVAAAATDLVAVVAASRLPALCSAAVV